MNSDLLAIQPAKDDSRRSGTLTALAHADATAPLWTRGGGASSISSNEVERESERTEKGGGRRQRRRSRTNLKRHRATAWPWEHHRGHVSSFGEILDGPKVTPRIHGLAVIHA